MFCVQCEQTIRTPAGNGCSYAQGMCGKTAETSDLQDLLIAALQGLSAWAVKAREYGIINHDVDSFAPRAFFSTLTNVNFDSPRIVGYAREAIALREALKAQCLAVDANARVDNPMADLQLVSDDLGELQRQAAEFTPNKDKAAIGENILGLRLLCLYGLKGAAAYMEHAHVLGQYDNDIYAQYHKIMAWLGTWPADMNALLECSMEIGQMNFKVMSILDAGETGKYGHPTPTQVNVKATAGKCILISGHDLKDLYNLLEQTEGTGVNVYTHGEMLPAHGYPELRKFKHLVGNYGSGWQNQQVEFARFPGPIVMTSNCIIDPTVGAYDDRIWTRSIVGWPGVRHLDGEDFSAVIAQAQQMAGFPYSEIPHLITVGFGRQTLLGAADTLIDLVSREKLRHIFLLGGCDGARGERHYFTDFATSVPDDCLILTLACGKYRFNKLEFGEVLVTGATSGLGRNAVEFLCQKGISVRATGRNEAMGKLLEKMGAEFVPADLTELVSSQAKVMLAGIDTLWHCSSFTSPWGTQQAFDLANVRATRRLGEWAVAWGVRNFIHISSPSLYFDYHHHRDIKEDFRPHRFANEFARSKAASEEVINMLSQANPQTRFTILRPQSLFGPHDKVFIPRLAHMMHHYGSILLPHGGSALVDMTYYENAVHAMWLASQEACDKLPSGRVYNITNGEHRTLRSIVQKLIDELNIDCRIRSVPYPMLDMIARSMERLGRKSAKEPPLTHYGVSKLNFDFTLDITRAQEELGYQPVITLDEGIEKTAAWLRDHGKLPR
nr:hydroxylamine reductase [Escherichia coli]